MYNRTKHHVEVLEQSVVRVSSRAEVHGAVQQVSDGFETDGRRVGAQRVAAAVHRYTVRRYAAHVHDDTQQTLTCGEFQTQQSMQHGTVATCVKQSRRT